MDLVSFGPRDPAVSRTRRLGLAAARSYRDQYGHLDVPADYTDPTGCTLGTFITTTHDAVKTGRLGSDWMAELDALGMIWDKHDAAWLPQPTTTACTVTSLPPPPPTSAPGSPNNASSPPRTSLIRPARTPWPTPTPGQQLITDLGLTPGATPLAPTRRARRTFEETVQLLELFPHREGRAPAARETIRVDGDTSRSAPGLPRPVPSTVPPASP
nr:helicase associated domain-containing protein [Streptomyces sp. MUM 203J]